MSLQTTLSRSEMQVGEARVPKDMRRHRRVPLSLSGRFMRADRNEYACTIKNISVGNVSVHSDTAVDLGERIVAYFDHLGGFEGIVTRVADGEFALQFRISEHKREKLAAQLMWLMNRDAFPQHSERAHDRVSTGGRRATLRIEDGLVIDVEVLDLSISGASLSTPARPALGSFVVLNKTRAIVRRHHTDGIGVQFLGALTPEQLRQSFP